jgi:hypothetical protein
MTIAAARPTPERMSSTLREIDRDERVVLLALRRRLCAAIRDALARPRRDLGVELDGLARAVAGARIAARRLNDARIVRRGERPQAEVPAALPAELRAHACHGAYLGAFPDLAAVGRMAVATALVRRATSEARGGALASLALQLHLRGVLWTLDHAGRVHVFRCRPR